MGEFSCQPPPPPPQIAAAISSPGDSVGDDSLLSGESFSPDQLHSVVDTVAAMGEQALESIKFG